ncbi:MAG: hypothetical protein IH608_10115 [Proteobacteria bacterium]|nr:hypothetical protein [Pseudomonadota bacterium]
MSRRRRDPMEPEIELALNPGRFITYGNCSAFIGGLEEVAAQIGSLESAEPARAASLYEAFLAGCYEKAEEIDDSAGSFGQFIEDLFRGWIRARRVAGENPDDTITCLLAWLDEDPYGFLRAVEEHPATFFDQAGLVAFERQIRARFDAAALDLAPAVGSPSERREYARHRWGEGLRAVYAAQKDVRAYLALAEEMGLTAGDCCVAAKLLAGRRKPSEALAWVERGLAMSEKTPYDASVAYDLAKLRRALLAKLGREDEALEAAWDEYCRHPDSYTYKDLLEFVPKADRAAWHEKAVDVLRGADIGPAIELLLALKEIGLLVERLRVTGDGELEALSHFVAEPVAKKLESFHPAIAARLWRAQGLRILIAKKSKYYEAALRNFERARRCFEKAGLLGDWDRTVGRVRGEHHRKLGFMRGFEELLQGLGPSAQPSFLEGAKARWGGRIAKAAQPLRAGRGSRPARRRGETPKGHKEEDNR